MSDTLLGRSAEKEILATCLNSKKAEFLALYGRRRIGKTYLIEQFFSKKQGVIFFSVMGSKGAPMKEQLQNFMDRLSETFHNGLTLVPPNNWREAFKMLTDAINQQDQKKKVVIFLDELPWLASPRSRVKENLDYFWNQYWSRQSNIKLIICGSSASWIINKIINDKGGLHNRVTKKIRLKPLTLLETKEFLWGNGVKLNNQQVLELYMVTGGIPFYLSEVSRGKTAAQIIESLAFKQESLLLKEFDNLYASLFNGSEGHIELMRIIAKKRYGLSQVEIAKSAKGFTKGGGVSKRLKELCDAGFIQAFTPYGHKKKNVFYRVIDEYTLFYLYWIEPIKQTLDAGEMEPGYWQAESQSPAWRSWSGYAFEAVCFKHLSLIRKKCGIPVTALSSAWRYVPSKNKKDMGAQIDLLYDRKDNAINFVEIKHSLKPYVIDKAYAQQILNKIQVFEKQTRTKKQRFICMVASSGLAENLYADDLIDSVVTLDDFFIRT